MALKRDYIDRNRVPDAPHDWERYARLLREHGRMSPGFGFDERLESEWDARVTEHRRLRNRRRVIAPFATLVVAGISFLIVSDSAMRNAMTDTPQASEPVLQSIPDKQQQNFAAPEIPPIWIDTNLPLIDPPVLPGMTDPSNLDARADSIRQHEPPVAGE